MPDPQRPSRPAVPTYSVGDGGRYGSDALGGRCGTAEHLHNPRSEHVPHVPRCSAERRGRVPRASPASPDVPRGLLTPERVACTVVVMPRHDTPQWRPIGERRWRDGLPPSSAERYETRGQLDSTAVSGDHRPVTDQDEDTGELFTYCYVCGTQWPCQLDGSATAAPGCPDGGSCHHECDGGPCWRVANAGPLSGVYPDDQWPSQLDGSAIIGGPSPQDGEQTEDDRALRSIIDSHLAEWIDGEMTYAETDSLLDKLRNAGFQITRQLDGRDVSGTHEYTIDQYDTYCKLCGLGPEDHSL